MNAHEENSAYLYWRQGYAAIMVSGLNVEKYDVSRGIFYEICFEQLTDQMLTTIRNGRGGVLNR
jgi:hypothetical protein